MLRISESMVLLGGAADGPSALLGAESGLTVLARTQRQCMLLSEEITALQVNPSSVQCLLNLNVDRWNEW